LNIAFKGREEAEVELVAFCKDEIEEELVPCCCCFCCSPITANGLAYILNEIAAIAATRMTSVDIVNTNDFLILPMR
jgi:hypothetical protein